MHKGRFIKSEKSNFGNPYRFRAAERSRMPYVLGGVFFVCGALLYWLFFSPSFAIARITVEGGFAFTSDTLKNMIEQQLGRTRWSIVPTRNIFAFSSEESARVMKDQFAIEQVYVKKDRPHHIAITVSEKPREAIWSTRNQSYALDNSGTVIAQTGSLDSGLRPSLGMTKNVPIIYDLSGAVVEFKQQVVSPAALGFISKLWQAENIKLLQPRYFTLPKTNATDLTLQVGDSAGWNIYFDTTMPLPDQLNALDLTLRNSVPALKRAKLNYIDLRFGERVYVKYH